MSVVVPVGPSDVYHNEQAAHRPEQAPVTTTGKDGSN